MMRTRRGLGRSTRRGLTSAQKEADEKAWGRCTHSIEGHYRRGDLVVDIAAPHTLYRVETRGRRYHEDVPTALYGVCRVSRGPAGWKETLELRRALEHVLSRGTHEPDSRGVEYEGGRNLGSPMPDTAVVARWQDAVAGSLATRPWIAVHEGGYLRAVSPIYDDSPVITWMHDPKLANKNAALIARTPRPVSVPSAYVRERTTRLTIDAGHPRYAAYAAARDACPHLYGIELPITEYQRVKRELDDASVPNPPSGEED